MAEKVKGFIDKKDIKSILIHQPINNFLFLSNDKIEELKQKVKFAVWEKYDNQHRVVRFATSWATTEENVNQLLELI